jgi:hypothetical protein
MSKKKNITEEQLKKLQNDVAENPEAIKEYFQKYNVTEEGLSSLLKLNFRSFEFMPFTYMSDINLIKKCITHYYKFFEFIPQILKEDKSFFLELVAINPEIKSYLNDALITNDDKSIDENFVKELINTDIESIWCLIENTKITYSETELQKDQDFIKKCIHENPEFFLYIDKNLQQNSNFILKLLEDNPKQSNLMYLLKEHKHPLLEDVDFMNHAAFLGINPNNYLPKEEENNYHRNSVTRSRNNRKCIVM